MTTLEDLVSRFVADVALLNGTADDGGVPINIGPVTYEASGWSHTHASDRSCPRSRLVDDLRNELYNKGYTKIADEIPVYHCIAFWLRTPFPNTLFINKDKFEHALRDFGPFAASLPDDDEDFLSDNIVWESQSKLVGFMSQVRDTVKSEYRGRKDQEGFAKVVWNEGDWSVDFSPSAPPNYTQLAVADAIKRPATQACQEFQRTFDANGFRARPIPGTERGDHYVYNAWWNGSTDEDVGRYWRNWAIAVGAKITPQK